MCNCVGNVFVCVDDGVDDEDDLLASASVLVIIVAFDLCWFWFFYISVDKDTGVGVDDDDELLLPSGIGLKKNWLRRKATSPTSVCRT